MAKGVARQRRAAARSSRSPAPPAPPPPGQDHPERREIPAERDERRGRAARHRRADVAIDRAEIAGPDDARSDQVEPPPDRQRSERAEPAREVQRARRDDEREPARADRAEADEEQRAERQEDQRAGLLPVAHGVLPDMVIDPLEVAERVARDVKTGVREEERQRDQEPPVEALPPPRQPEPGEQGGDRQEREDELRVRERDAAERARGQQRGTARRCAITHVPCFDEERPGVAAADEQRLQQRLAERLPREPELDAVQREQQPGQQPDRRAEETARQ